MSNSLIPFANAILVTMRLSGEYLMLCTTDKDHGRSQRFLTNAALLRNWLNHPDGTSLIDCDLNNYLAFHRFSPDKVTMRFTWLTLHDSRGDRLHGYQQTLIMPLARIRRALIGFKVKVLLDPEMIPQCKLTFSESAQGQIAKICADKREKRALCKALRDNFHWRDSGEVYMVADWQRDFYFTTDDIIHLRFEYLYNIIHHAVSSFNPNFRSILYAKSGEICLRWRYISVCRGLCLGGVIFCNADA